ncbi:MAG TPA: GH116 family glycosyl hydrolase, partial [Vicinamibacteria bacterium]
IGDTSSPTRSSRTGLVLDRPARAGRFFVVAGRRAAVFGQEGQSLEAWAYPLELADDFRLSFRLEGYHLDIPGASVLAAVSVRPEATVFTYSHAAFTVRQTVFAPIDEPGIVMLLDVDSVLPMTITGSFRPRLRLMWPAGLMTANVEWNEKERVYYLTEETRRFAAVVGTPGGVDHSTMPYQEEPRDVPLRFSTDVPPRDAGGAPIVPIVLAGSVAGRREAKVTYERLLASAEALYEANVAYYRELLASTVRVKTPDPRVDAAFDWARVGIDKGLATNPLLGTGFLAGFRTAGQSERPGFAWFFGRDALWTALATTSYGDLPATRLALDFLRVHQRGDGKIPHEISQSATLLPWFEDYDYPWNSADATPLYVAAHGDYFRATGDRAFLEASWSSIRKAYLFTAATDSDGNDLVENTSFGHGWVEGGALYPPHEEIYMQGVWVEASRAMTEMADAMGDGESASLARGWAERTSRAMEETYWLKDRGFYAFATARPRETPKEAEPGPHRPRRQARLEALAGGGLVDEDTVLPAVPLWWRELTAERAQSEIDHLGGAALATDWGSRILADRSDLYDPLSYHYGSVWPLFTGWASMAAYRYGRPTVGYQALMANVLLTEQGALGSVTELLSGDYDAAFGRSSHHQIWSQAMVVSPLLRGLFGIEARDAGRTLAVAPQLPPDWDRAEVRGVVAGGARCDLVLARRKGRLAVEVERHGGSDDLRLVISPAFPPDARVRGATVDGVAVEPEVALEGDVQKVSVVVPGSRARTEVVFELDEGTEVEVPVEAPEPGSRSEGLRLLRARVEDDVLALSVEGLSGRPYRLRVRSPRRPGSEASASVAAGGDGLWDVRLTLDGPAGAYVRRDLRLPLLP